MFPVFDHFICDHVIKFNCRDVITLNRLLFSNKNGPFDKIVCITIYSIIVNVNMPRENLYKRCVCIYITLSEHTRLYFI